MLQELRIGNWIEAVANMGNYKMQMTEHNFLSLIKNPNCASPIPLTPETISKCTTLYNKVSNDWWDCYQSENGWHIGYSKHIEPSAGVETGKFYYGDGFYPVKYVHDLQNLYFYTSFKKELEFIW